jgi:hypothetical protein
LKVFKLYLDIKNCINLLNETNFTSLSSFSKVNDNVFNLFYSYPNHQKRRCYSTLTNNKDFVTENELEDESSKESFKFEKELEIKTFKKRYKGGYLGYDNFYSLGNVSSFIVDYDPSSIDVYQKILESKVNEYLSEIPESVTYSILPVLRTLYADGEYKSLTISKAIKITRFTSSHLLTSILLESLIKSILKYDLEGIDIHLYLLDRPWLVADDFNTNLSEVTKVLDGLIEREIYSWSKFSDLNNSDKAVKLKNYKYKDIYMGNYGEKIFNKNKILIGYRINKYESASIETFFNSEYLLCNKILIKDFDEVKLSFKGEALITWVDTRTSTGFTRELGTTKYIYDKNNKIINLEIKYNQPKFPIYKLDASLENKIGTIDFETYGTNLGLGYHQVYAAGFSIKDKTELFYIEHGETSEQLVSRFFWNILMNKSLNGYTFYVHNLGRFDSVFILKSLIPNKDITLTPVWKDNSILSLTIKHFKTKLTILDSLQLIPGSLENILKSFNCKIKKGQFPYKAVSKKKLFYIGSKPAKIFYNNISESEYLAIPDKNWDLKVETLKYLKSDVEGLLEAVTKFRDSINKKYNLNVTKFKTLPGLALAAYTSNYFPNQLIPRLKMIKGGLEKRLRSSYFGGNVEVFINKIDTGYLYDMNSQYAKAMLNDMPVGDPVLSLETDLNKIFGFVYGEISCPSESELQVPFIQYRGSHFNYNSCPRGKFKRLIFSQEIKYALKYGYKINIEYSYVFERGKDLFKDYVNDHYELKKTTKDPVKRALAKLFLNSLYGRLGMNEVVEKMGIVDKETVESLDKTHNVSIMSELANNRYLVKYSNEINESLKNLYTKDPSILSLNKTLKKTKDSLKTLELNKTKNISSAVHIASAISSYARILINEYKNIPGNPCIMSDTDSAVLTKPLPTHLVGDGLGQIKLVSEIKKGIFIKKKLYCILDVNNKEIIKASGIDSSKLDFNSFVVLLNGGSVELERTNFNVEWKTLNVNVTETKITVQGLKGDVKTIYNTRDVNFKFISLPKKYDIIVHPNYPVVIESLQKDKEINLNQNQTEKDSDLFILFSNFEIILFFISLIFLLIFIFIYLLFFK